MPPASMPCAAIAWLAYSMPQTAWSRPARRKGFAGARWLDATQRIESASQLRIPAKRDMDPACGIRVAIAAGPIIMPLGRRGIGIRWATHPPPHACRPYSPRRPFPACGAPARPAAEGCVRRDCRGAVFPKPARAWGLIDFPRAARRLSAGRANDRWLADSGPRRLQMTKRPAARWATAGD